MNALASLQKHLADTAGMSLTSKQLAHLRDLGNHAAWAAEDGLLAKDAAYYAALVEVDRRLGIKPAVAAPTASTIAASVTSTVTSAAATPVASTPVADAIKAAAAAGANRELDARNAARARAGKEPLTMTAELRARHLLAAMAAWSGDSVHQSRTTRDSVATAKAFNAARTGQQAPAADRPTAAGATADRVEQARATARAFNRGRA